MLHIKARGGVETNMLAETTMDSVDAVLWLLSAVCVQPSEQCVENGVLLSKLVSCAQLLTRNTG
jgi:hypothetical protein